VPLAASGRDPNLIGLGPAPRNERSAGGGPGGLGSPYNTTVPPSERARALRIYTSSDKKRSWEPDKKQFRLRQFKGLPIYIETHKGERRRSDWAPLAADYGYISMTGSPEGRGEGLDVFLGDDARSSFVTIIDQVDPETGEFDEHKVMLGFPDRRSAVRAYLDSYDDASRMGGVWTVDFDTFMRLLDNGGWNKKITGKEVFG
jgi:hypothetical protein